MIRLLTLLLLAASPAAACRLALALALDVSASVDSDEYRLQREGLARALEDPEIQALLPDVALTVYEWAGERTQLVTQDWVLIYRPADAQAVADRLRSLPRSQTDRPTALGQALAFATARFAVAPPCLRQTLDISGDGRNNQGFPPNIAKRYFPLDDITINALVVASDQTVAGLTAYFVAEVIQGPGAFVETAIGYTDYGRAMRRKLIRELGGLRIGHN